MTLIIYLILYVYLGYQAGSGLHRATTWYPGDSAFLTQNTCFDRCGSVIEYDRHTFLVLAGDAAGTSCEG